MGGGGGGGRGAKAKVHTTFWVVGGVGVVDGWWVVGGGLGKVGWVVYVWVRLVGLSWAGFVELSSVGWVPESGVRGHHSTGSTISRFSPPRLLPGRGRTKP